MWPDWAIYWTLGNFSKLLATIILPKSPTFLGKFCKGVKIFNFSSGIIFITFINIWRFFSGHTVVAMSIGDRIKATWVGLGLQQFKKLFFHLPRQKWFEYFMVGHFEYNHRYLVENKVAVLIFCSIDGNSFQRIYVWGNKWSMVVIGHFDDVLIKTCLKQCPASNEFLTSTCPLFKQFKNWSKLRAKSDKVGR